MGTIAVICITLVGISSMWAGVAVKAIDANANKSSKFRINHPETLEEE